MSSPNQLSARVPKQGDIHPHPLVQRKIETVVRLSSNVIDICYEKQENTILRAIAEINEEIDTLEYSSAREKASKSATHFSTPGSVSPWLEAVTGAGWWWAAASFPAGS